MKNGVVSTKPSTRRSSGDNRIGTPPTTTTKEKQMSENTEKAEPTAPKPGRGFTVVELRTSHQSDIVKAAGKGLAKDALTVSDRWVVVKNTEAQAVIDRVFTAGQTVGIFDRRVLDYFTAVVLLSNEKLTDSRSSLHQRLIAVGRGTKGFAFEMKQDGTLAVKVGAKTYPTQKAAMADLAPDKLKADTTPSTVRAARTTAAANKVDRIATAKAEHKALKEWNSKPVGARGPKPTTPALDAMEAEKEAKAS